MTTTVPPSHAATAALLCEALSQLGGPVPTGGASEPTPETLHSLALSVLQQSQTMAQRHAALEEACQTAQTANRRKSAFLANMSHEIRTPMTSILGMTELALATPLSETQREHLQTIQESGLALLEIVNDILDLSKIEAGLFTVERRPLVLKTVLDSSTKWVWQAAHDKGLALSCVVAPEVPEAILGDRTRLRQVLLNLLWNAVKFTQCGSIELSVHTETPVDRPERLVFSVTDTGMGMSPEQQASVFQPYVQWHTQEHHGGTGLGLGIARHLVELMGGEIGVSSEPGLGSRFRFWVPCSRTTPAQPPVASLPPHSVTERRSRKNRILLVEDHPANQKLALHLLKREGYQTTLAENGAEAVRLLHALAFDLVLMDVQMPVMDGFETTRRIRRLEREREDKHHPIIAMTAGAVVGDREKCLAAGMDDYLSKPLKTSELLSKLAFWLSH